MNQREAGWSLLGVSLLAIGAATLQPLPGQTGQSAITPLSCLLCGEVGLADFLLNIVLFLPLGAAASLLALGPRPALVLAGLTSLTVEALQYAIGAGRDPTLGDLIANTLGGWLGHLAMLRWPALRRPSRAQARRYLVRWSLLGALIIAGTNWGLRPRIPPAPWFGQWAVHAPEEGWVAGTVDAAWLGQSLLQHGPLQDGEARRPALLQGALRLAATVQLAKSPRAPVRVIAVGNDSERFLQLDMTPRGVRFQGPMQARCLRLRTPRFFLTSGAVFDEGGKVALEGALERGWIRIRAQGEAAEARDGKLRLGWWDGWMLLLPTPVPLGWPVYAMRMAWLAWLLIPLGWWGWQGWRGPLSTQPK